MKLGLGTVQFGLKYGIANNNGHVLKNDTKRILNYARKKGILTLDTAPTYGKCEKLLGNIGIANCQVITKTIALKNGINEVVNTFYQSLDNLKVDKVYGLLIHNYEDIRDKSFDSLLYKLNLLKENGVIKKIGFSVYKPEQAAFLLNNYKFDLIQVPFNILDRRMIDSGVFTKLKQNKVEIHVRSIFLQGLLIMPEGKRPKRFNRWKNLWKIWHQWLNDNQISALDATVRYTLSNPQITKVIFGVNSLIQLKEVLVSASGDLPKLPSELFSDDAELLNPSNW